MFVAEEPGLRPPGSRRYVFILKTRLYDLYIVRFFLHACFGPRIKTNNKEEVDEPEETTTTNPVFLDYPTGINAKACENKSSLPFSRSSSQESKNRGRTAAEIGDGDPRIAALVERMVLMFDGWTVAFARGKVRNELALCPPENAGNCLAWIGRLLDDMTRRGHGQGRGQIRDWDFGYVHGGLAKIDLDGPPPPPTKPKPPAAPVSQQPRVQRSVPASTTRPGYLAELRKAHDAGDQARIKALEAEAEAAH
jgi:hypothetical protein